MKQARAGRLVRPALVVLGLGLALIGNAPASAQPLGSRAAAVAPPQSVAAYYQARSGRPLWLAGGPEAAAALLDLLRTAQADGLDPRRYPVDRIERALQAAAGGNRRALQGADQALSAAFVTYVRDLKTTPSVPIEWVDPGLKPVAGSDAEMLTAAEAAPDLTDYVRRLGWMNPHYAELRAAIAHGAALSSQEEALLELNRERARALPASGRYVVVNAADATLTMFEGRSAVDQMKVVVGKPVYPTPMMAAYIRFASLNPYWNVPADLAAERIAPNVMKEGVRYLRAQGYQLFANWDEDRPLDPATVDWKAVAAGKIEVRVRQLPGPHNAMGRMKFMFPNSQGVYLHDTPQKELMAEASRLYSGGCVRLEDAPRLARWLFGKPLAVDSKQPELKVDLPRPVPVFLTYLTAVSRDGALAFLPDVYGRDARALAGGQPSTGTLARR